MRPRMKLRHDSLRKRSSEESRRLAGSDAAGREKEPARSQLVGIGTWGAERRLKNDILGPITSAMKAQKQPLNSGRVFALYARRVAVPVRSNQPLDIKLARLVPG